MPPSRPPDGGVGDLDPVDLAPGPELCLLAAQWLDAVPGEP